MNKEKNYYLRSLSAKEEKEENAQGMNVEGYAIVFDSPETYDGYTEIIDKKALDDCDLSDICMKYNHEGGALILARTRNNSLKLSIDERGLKIEANLDDGSQYNKDIYAKIKSGTLDKMSFAFVVDEEEENFKTNTRTITKIGKVFEVSVVDVPFYSATEIHARNIEHFEESRKAYNGKVELAKAKAIAMMSL